MLELSGEMTSAGERTGI